MIEVENLSKRYGDKLAVDGLDPEGAVSYTHLRAHET